MKDLFPVITKCMLWFSIPLVFGFEYLVHFLKVSNGLHLFFQILILALTIKWVLFWEEQLVRYEMEKSSRVWYVSKNSINEKYKR
jgi:hypothetical protein